MHRTSMNSRYIPFLFAGLPSSRCKPPQLEVDALCYHRGMTNEDESDEPRCPHCQGATVLVRTFPKIGGFPELRSCSCTLCEEVVTVERKA
jgi:hypothetical protein